MNDKVHAVGKLGVAAEGVHLLGTWWEHFHLPAASIHGIQIFPCSVHTSIPLLTLWSITFLGDLLLRLRK